MADRGRVLLLLTAGLFCGSAYAAEAGALSLQVIDAGPSAPITPYFGYLLASDDQPLAGIDFPITSRLTPGRLAARAEPLFDARWLAEPVFLLATDAASLAWLQRHAAALRRLGATGIVMAAPDEQAFRRLQRAANDVLLQVAPGPDHWLEEQLLAHDVGVLPLLIHTDGRATQEVE